MKLGITLYSGDSETVWNAFRFGNFALAMGDSVRMFLLGKGVEFESKTTAQFGIAEQVKTYLETGGKIWACGTCLQIHGLKESDFYTVSSMRDLYEIVKESDKLVGF